MVAKIKSLKGLTKKLKFYKENVVKKNQSLEIYVKANEGIFIPEGYWHKVSSV